MPLTTGLRDLQMVDPVLTEIARQYKPKGYVYDQVAPTINVNTDSGKYPVFDAAYFFGDEVGNKVADRAVTPEVDFKFSDDSYLCEDYRLKVSIADREKEQANTALKLQQSKLNFLLARMATARERRLAALLRKTSNGGGLNLGAGVSNKWDVDAATIEADIKTAINSVYDTSGIEPNTIIIPRKVATEISVQQDIRELFKYTVNGLDQLSKGPQILPTEIWGLKVIIPKAKYNTAAEGLTQSNADIWGDNVVVMYSDTSAQWGEPSCVYSFKRHAERVDTWREEDPPVEYIRAWETVDEKVVAPDCGYEITDVLT